MKNFETIKTAKPEFYRYQRIQKLTEKQPKAVLRERLNEFFETYNITPHDLGEMAHNYGQLVGVSFSRTNIYSYLQGVASPKIDRLVVLAHVMCVPISWLTGYDDDFDEKALPFKRIEGNS